MNKILPLYLSCIFALWSALSVAQTCSFGGGFATNTGTALQSLTPGATICFDRALTRGDDYTLLNLIVNAQYRVETCGEPAPSNNPAPYDSYLGVWTTGGSFIGESLGGTCGDGDDESFTFTATATSHVVQIRDESCNTSLGGFHDFCVTYLSAPLPVELMTFEAQRTDDAISLHWKTASEFNNDKFIIEQSWDAEAFEQIGEVPGNGTTNEQKAYSFTLNSTQSGFSYFRLKQMDFDGQYTYSDIISLELDGNHDKQNALYPNPSPSGLVNLSYTAPKEEVIPIHIFNTSGQIVAYQQHSVSIGFNQLALDFSYLSPGIYLFQFGMDNRLMQKRFVIK